ncbi:cold shock domain-containing protein [Roseateles cellulosilyticus]|uniref:Cold shock domain-containing protein n=1 Tax=Pelomonas cellulosilytica TaxID=2906762 RepID=A0ABS8XXT4_9BURK|nr:cold shock domain-containing protein [Pelomonas sp. P8]MCE4555657.1 cold shock domain-containing protein [Pelomonas sp. P8]
MRSSGILRSWNDERGFGFIAPTQGGPELFVHISAFPRDGSKPVVGETVSFERGRGADGRPQAVQVVRAAVGSRPAVPRSPAAPEATRRGGAGLLGGALLLVVLVVAGTWGTRQFQQASLRRQLESTPVTSPPVAAPAEPATPFRCDGRTQCSQMTSCAEATWFINHCTGTQMDGNRDGVPCEQQWCTGPTIR